jgi:AcrR family transcriptional regulator
MSHETGGREFILDTAAKLFSQKGYTGVSIRDIAEASRMTHAALYYHFKNKKDLYLAVLRRGHEKVMLSMSETTDTGGSLRDRLKQLVLRYAVAMCGQRQSFHTLRRDLSSLDDARAGKLLGEMRADFMRPMQQVIEAGQVDGQIVAGDAKLYARLLNGMIMALTFESKFGQHGRLTPDETDTVVNVFLNGVGANRKA